MDTIKILVTSQRSLREMLDNATCLPDGHEIAWILANQYEKNL